MKLPVASDGDGKTILIIDDTPANIGLLVDYLEEHGMRIVVAQDGGEGIKRAQFAQPNLILLDVMMPGFDGFETCRRLKASELTRDIPVIFMTALSDASEKVIGFGVGGVDYVTKPLQMEEVLARVNTHLSLRSMRKQLEQRNAQLQQEIEVRQKAEDALRLTQFSVDQASDAVLWLTPTGAIFYVNEAACKLTQHPRELLMALHAFELEVDATPERWEAQWKNIKERRSCVMETRIRIKGRVVIPVEMAVTYQGYAGREYIVVSARNITERKRAEQSLKDGYTELKEANGKLETLHRQLLQSEKMASIGQLAAGVAHEINNPISYIHANLGTLQTYFANLMQLVALYERTETLLIDYPEMLQAASKMRKELDLDYVRADLKSLMEESLEGVQRVRRIVQDLRDFSQGGGSTRQAIDLHACIDSTLHIIASEIERKADLRKEYGDVPNVQGAPVQLNQVFLNLLVNAGQAIEGRGTITVRTGCQDAWVWVEVEDTGCGITAENLDRVFDPFFTTKAVGSGIGLGLSLSYGIVAQHGGRIDVRSEVGRGSVFRVWLPLDASSG